MQVVPSSRRRRIVQVQPRNIANSGIRNAERRLASLRAIYTGVWVYIDIDYVYINLPAAYRSFHRWTESVSLSRFADARGRTGRVYVKRKTLYRGETQARVEKERGDCKIQTGIENVGNSRGTLSARIGSTAVRSASSVTTLPVNRENAPGSEREVSSLCLNASSGSGASDKGIYISARAEKFTTPYWRRVIYSTLAREFR